MTIMRNSKKALLKRAISILMVLCMMCGVMLPAMSFTAVAAAPSVYTDILADSTVAVRISTGGTPVYFRFIPTATGTYEFYSSSKTGGDPYGELLNSSGASIYSNDDGAGSLNFKIRYDLTAGNVYYIRASMLGTGTGSYTLHAKTISVVCDHEWSETSRVDATCEADGRVSRVCTKCSYNDETTLTKLGHNYVGGVCTNCGGAEPAYTPVSEYNSTSGDVFLGGKYIELGISRHGSFGTSASPRTSGFHSSGGLGMKVDGDGWDFGNAPTTGDFFLPGTPEERYMFAYYYNGTKYEYIVGDRVNVMTGSWITQPTVRNESAGSMLRAVVSGVTEHNVELEITYSFGVNDKSYKTEVKITNRSELDITNARFVRSFDPDQDQQTRGSFSTYNKVLANPDRAIAASDTNYAMVVARGHYTFDGFFFIAFDNRAYASQDVSFAPESAYLSGLWEATHSSPTYATEDSMFVSAANPNGYNLEDTGIAIAFNLNTISASGDTSLEYFSSMSPNVETELEELLQPVVPTVNAVSGASVAHNSEDVGPSVDATVADGHTVSYQWYVNSENSNVGGTFISGANSAFYEITERYPAGTVEYYYCVVTATRNDNGLYATVTSDPVAVEYLGNEHTFEETSRTEPTCTTDGVATNVCYCGYSEDTVIPALGHDYVEGVCSRCGDTRGGKVLLIEDILPWGVNANSIILNRLVSEGKIEAFEKHSSSELASGTVNMNDYALVIFAADQDQSFYNNIPIDAVAAYAQNGGSVFLAADTSGATSGIYRTFPFGIISNRTSTGVNYIVDNTHPMITGIYSDNKVLSNSDMYGSSISHNYFTNMPENTNVILRDGSERATLIEFEYGQGLVVVSGLTFECAYENNWPFVNGYDDIFVHLYNQNSSAPGLPEDPEDPEIPEIPEIPEDPEDPEAPESDVWDGTVDTSWYNSYDREFTIYTAEQLAGLARLVNNGNTFAGKIINLANNIDLAGINWTAIGYGINTGETYSSTYCFQGTFNGNHHTVYNLSITGAPTTFTGLFGCLYNGARIYDLGVADAKIEIRRIVNYRTTAGILAGATKGDVVVSGCFATGTVNVVQTTSNIIDIGGFIGECYDADLINCYCIADVTASSQGNQMVGIMCGYANTDVSVTNCFAYGDCAATGSGSKFVGAFAGGNNNYPIINSYFCSAQSDKNATRLSEDQLKDIASFRGWDFESIWDMGADHPILRGFSEGGGIVVPPVEEEHVHSFVETSRTAPTCTTYGQIGYTCSCGEIRNELIEPTQHDYYIGYTCDPTCTEDGYIEFTCLNEGCRASKRQTIEALGHSYGYDSVCDRCGHRIESHAHNYVTTVVEPTCSSTGYTEYYCSCGHSYKGNFVEPTRHAWNGGEESMPANCTTDGIVIYTCEDCGATKTTIIKAEHTWSETVTVEKTCTTDGSVTKTCTVCGIVNVEIIPAGHVWNEGVETLAPTCETAGSKTCVCTVCSVEQSFEVNALGHRYVDGVCERCGEKFIDNIVPSEHPLYGMYFEIDDILSDYGPSLIDEYGVMLDYNSDAILEKVAVYLVQEGTMWRRCIAVKGTNIKYATYVPYLSYDSEIKYTGLNHDWINIFRLSDNGRGVWCYSDFATIGVNLQDAYGNLLLSLYDIGQAGAETRIFDDLDEMKAWLYGTCEEHTPSDWIVETPASCADGSQYKICTACGELITTEIIPAVSDHVASEWIVDLEPSSIHTGLRHKECTVCGETVETNVMPILAKLVIENVEAEAGHRVRVTIDIQNNPGIIGALLTLHYDPALKLVDVEAGSAWNSLSFTKPAVFGNPCNFIWDGVAGADFSNGSIIVLTFELPLGVDVGTVYNISATYTKNNMINADLETVDVEIESGSITVVNTIGDVDDNGIVDVADVIVLRRYLVGGYEVSIDTTAADMDADGEITVADVVLLRRFLVG